MDKLLELKNISKSYSGVEVLRDITVDLDKGEVLCFVGEKLAKRPEKIRLLFVISDGFPNATRYNGKKAEEDTQAATEAETTPAPPATLAPAAGEPFCNMARTRRSSQAANRTPPITVWS